RVTTPEPLVAGEEVHRTTDTTDETGLLAVELGHARARIAALRDRETVIAVGGDDAVPGAHQIRRGDRDRLLTDVKMQETADFALRIGTRGRFFETADAQHLAVKTNDVFLLVHGPFRCRRSGSHRARWHGCIGVHGEPSRSPSCAPALEASRERPAGGVGPRD